ncbi:putative sieve element occlusion, Thioredoxin-like superfamily, protein SIEVE ELEMENT OCCLUSION [Helianthus annuus]|nr:putative sieve element occlusion, Thioredoxin-like superfamily, protein SIEVE ELEMENT OCCLUSION [Helianthus annuus]
MATSRTRRARGDRHMFSSADDNAMMKNILATHSPDGTSIDVIPLLQIIEDIMHRARPDASHHGSQAELDAIVDSVLYNDVNEMLEVMALTINKVSCEISCKCIGGGDAHATTTGIFNMLSNYGWDAKAVITLAAFAVNYGEFWLVAQLYSANPLAKSLAHLKQLPSVLEHGESLKPRFSAVTSLIKAMLDVTHCIIKFKELPEQYISPDTPELVIATTHIPTAVYWIIRSIVSCASILINLIGMGHEHITTTTEAWELSSLAHKISNIHDHLKHHLDLCNHHINEKKHVEAYLTLLRIMDTPHLDNMKPLKHLIYLKDDQLPLYESSTKNRVSIEILRKKIVLLLISDLDLRPEELSVLDQMYREARQDPTRPESQYEVVWLPVVTNHNTTPWTEGNQIKFEGLRNMMPWYSVFHPSLLDPAVIKYIKEVWHFNQKPMLVVMDPQGRIVNTNALHMMWIWGSVAFPFTSLREEALWREETWRIELLADSIEPMIFNWVADGKYICLYGGEDIDWIRKFTTTAQTVARRAGIQLEMLYVGKSNPREKVRKNNDIIRAENLSYVLDLTLIWFFWVRLESMLHSKLQHGKSFDEDLILREINVMLTYDGNNQGWAVICRGSDDWMRRVNGETILTSLNKYDEWMDEAAGDKGFLVALNDHLEANRPPHHCNRLILPGTAGSVPERVVCAECGRSMERFFLYQCCTD